LFIHKHSMSTRAPITMKLKLREKFMYLDLNGFTYAMPHDVMKSMRPLIIQKFGVGSTMKLAIITIKTLELMKKKSEVPCAIQFIFVAALKYIRKIFRGAIVFVGHIENIWQTV